MIQSRKLWTRFRYLMCFAFMVSLYLSIGTQNAQATPKLTWNGDLVTPHHNHSVIGWGEYASGAGCDGTSASWFVIDGPGILPDAADEIVTDVRLYTGAASFNKDSSAPYINFVGSLYSPRWIIRGDQIQSGTLKIEITWHKGTGADQYLRSDFPSPFTSVVVSGDHARLFRQDLWPDRTTSPQIKNDPLLIIQNGQDIRGRDEGSSSSVYEFRIRYQHPGGLPPFASGLFKVNGNYPTGYRYKDGFNASGTQAFKKWIPDINNEGGNGSIPLRNGVAVVFGSKSPNIVQNLQGIYHYMQAVRFDGTKMVPYSPTSADYKSDAGVIYRWRWEPGHSENNNGQADRPAYFPGTVGDNRFGVGFENITGKNFLSSVNGYQFSAGSEYFPAFDETMNQAAWFRSVKPGILDDNPDTGEPWDPRVAPNLEIIPNYPIPATDNPKILTSLWGVDWSSSVSNWLYLGTISAGAKSTRDLVNPDKDLVTRQGPFHPLASGYTQMNRNIIFDTPNESGSNREISLLKNQVPVFYGTKAGEYVFNIRYWGQNIPSSIYVVIKNRLTNLTRRIPLTLTAVPGEIIIDSVSAKAALIPSNAGDTYSATVNLSDMVGSNEYYFEATDGDRIVNYPVRNSDDPMWPSQNVFVGPYVNNPPSISNISVSPSTGTYNDKITFKVTYSDPDKQRPQRYRLWLKVKPYTVTDGGKTFTTEWRSFIMNPVDPIPATSDNEVLSSPQLVDWDKGVQFEYTVDANTELWSLGDAKSMTGKYFFEFMDSWGDPADPAWKNPLDYLTSNVPGEVVVSPAGTWIDKNNDNRINYSTTDSEIIADVAANGPTIQIEVKPYVVMPSTTVGAEIDWAPAADVLGGEDKNEIISGTPRVAVYTKYVQKNARAASNVTVETAPLSDNEILNEKWKDASWKPSSASTTVVAAATDTSTDYVNGKGYKALLPDIATNNYVYRVQATNNASDEFGSVVGPWQRVTKAIAITEPTLGLKDALDADVVAEAPASGDDKTTYTFRVVYKDTLGLGPGTKDGAFVNMLIGINKMSFPMSAVKADGTAYTPTSDDYIAGVIFQVKLTPDDVAKIGLGQHDYSFIANNGTKDAVALTGASKVTINQFDKLSAAGVSVLRDAETNAITGYTFRVTYTDAQGSKPIGGIEQVNVTVGGKTFTMDTEAAGINYVSGGMLSKTVAASDLPQDVVVRNAYFRFGEGVGQLTISGLASLVKTSSSVSYTSVQNQLPVKFNVKYVGGVSNDAPMADSMKVTIKSASATKSFPLTISGNAPTDWTKGAAYTATISSDEFFTAGDYTFTFNGMDSNGLSLELSNTAFKFSIASIPTSTFDIEAGLDLVALPLVPSSSVLADFIGIDPATINAMTYTGSSNAPYAAAVTADANSGYWIKPAAAMTLTLKGSQADQTAAQSYTLRKGWNLIGVQFLNGSALADATVTIGGVTTSLAQAGLQDSVGNWAWGYNKTSGSYKLVDGRNGNAGVLNIGRGYWIYSWVEGAVLKLYAQSGIAPASVAKSNVTVDWVANLKATCGDRSDTATIGVASQASRTLKPAALAEYVQIVLNSNGLVAGEDIRRTGNLTNVYTFDVITDQQNQPVTIQLDGIARLAGKYDVMLTDISGNVTRSLTGSGSYTFNSGAAAKRSFKVTVGPRSNQSPVITALRVAKTRGGVAQISFGLSNNATTTVEVMDVTGQLVKQLNSSSVSKGTNTVTWDGRNQAGVSVPAGAYIVKVRADSEDGSSSQAMSPFVVVR